jgi:geranylgeranyl reductase
MTPRVLVVGASVGGATAANTLRTAGIETIMLERELVKPKPCGGAVPPAAFHEFDIPQHLIDRKIHNCLVESPSGTRVSFPVAGSVPGDEDYVAMVRREVFDHFLRDRAIERGAELIHGKLTGLRVDGSGVEVTYQEPDDSAEHTIRADVIVGADGAYSPTARLLGLEPTPRAVAIQERILLPPEQLAEWEDRADLYLGREVSPDFYAWAFPKLDHVAFGIGVGPKHSKQTRQLLENFKARLGSSLKDGKLLLREAHSLPMEPRKQMAFDRVMLVGDAAGLVVHTSGEGIYWAMKSGQMAAQTLTAYLDAPVAENLRNYERLWWQEYGSMYQFLRYLETWGYGNERQMEVFTEMCRNRDVQRLTFDSYMHKRMAPAPWLSQMKMTKDIIVSQVKHYVFRHPRPLRQKAGSETEAVTA